MPPTDAVRAVFTNYAKFRGRARRPEYWWFVVFNIIVSIICFILDRTVGSSIFQNIYALAIVVPSLALCVRRLHDTGKSGWMILLALIPLIGVIILVVFVAQDSQPGPNQYDPSPNDPTGEPGRRPARIPKRPGQQGGYGAPFLP